MVIGAVIEYLEKSDFIKKVNFVYFENENFEIYRKISKEWDLQKGKF
ncbi:hypothetical protein [Helicobacter acinonychis]